MIISSCIASLHRRFKGVDRLVKLWPPATRREGFTKDEALACAMNNTGAIVEDLEADDRRGHVTGDGCRGCHRFSLCCRLLTAAMAFQLSLWSRLARNHK